MLRPLYEKLIEDNEVFITARDFDSTFYLLDNWGIDYIPVGKYGGALLIDKLKAYSDRLSRLINIVNEEKPDFLLCITSPEALRISFGLKIPNIMFNDEPRSYGPCMTTFPFVDQVIVPKCIPLEWYLQYGLKEEKIIRFNGIDEVGWLSDFNPNSNVLKNLDVNAEHYIVCRTEPSKAGYLADKMEPHDTQLTEILPDLINKTPNLKYLIITRNDEQYNYLKKIFKIRTERKNVSIYKGLDNLADTMYFAKLVISGGGTMVRESALLGVPSIEYFPLDTYPQEQFLIDNNFPLIHEKDSRLIIENALNFIEGDYKINTTEKINVLENPIERALREFRKRILN